MNYDKFIQPEKIKVGDSEFTISRIPALDAQPIYKEVAKSVTENGVIGITMLPMNVIKAILGYVAYDGSPCWIVLDSDRIINECFKDTKDLHEVIIRMIKLNFGFLINGDLLDLLADKEATDSAS